ncbi:MAG TPA: TraR/DksA C4-type zinc finger protein [Acidimicrobiales bacterium]
MPRATKAATATSASAKKRSAASRKVTGTARSSAGKKSRSSAATKSRSSAATKARTRPAKKAGTKAAKKAPTLDKFLEGQLRSLEEERATYLRQAEALQAEADSLTEDREPGDVQFDEESGEGDTLAVERERDLALSAQARAAIEQIDTAIRKIRDGTYGLCESCGSPIPKERLKALPHAALCVKCKSGGLGLRR